MKLEVNGVQYTNFMTARCDIRLDSLSRTFDFSAAVPEGQPLPFKGGEPCNVIVDGEKVLTGFIEVISIDYSGGIHTTSISGRDKTADLLDSTIDVIDDIRGDGLTLKALIEIVINKIGLDIIVIDEVSPPPFNAAEDVAAPEPGENAFSFIEKYARKRQVLLTSNGDGNLVIATNSGQKAEGAVQHIIGAEDNNVLSCSFSYDTTGRYNSYKISSELNPIALNLAGDTDPASTVNQGGRAFDDEIRPSRQLVLKSEVSFSDSNSEKRAKWEADIRKARGLVYSAIVPLYRVGGNDGDIWLTNRLYQIVDDYVGKIELMLCNSISFTLDVDDGSNTTLGFVGERAYTLLIDSSSSAEVATNVQ